MVFFGEQNLAFFSTLKIIILRHIQSILCENIDPNSPDFEFLKKRKKKLDEVSTPVDSQIV